MSDGVDDCLFCKIIKGEVPSNKVYEDDSVYAFYDISPMAKTHLLFIHKNHTKNILELTRENPDHLVELFQAVEKYSKESEIEEYGLRIVTNVGSSSGQTIFHTHLHVLSGEQLGRFGRV